MSFEQAFSAREYSTSDSVLMDMPMQAICFLTDTAKGREHESVPAGKFRISRGGFQHLLFADATLFQASTG